MGQTEWDWPIATNDTDTHIGRVTLLRQIEYELMPPLQSPTGPTRRGQALTLNMSRSGMLVMMDRAPAIEQVVKVRVPTPLGTADTPTLTEVRWRRRIPFGSGRGKGTYFVGLKFIL